MLKWQTSAVVSDGQFFEFRIPKADWQEGLVDGWKGKFGPLNERAMFITDERIEFLTEEHCGSPARHTIRQVANVVSCEEIGTPGLEEALPLNACGAGDGGFCNTYSAEILAETKLTGFELRTVPSSRFGLAYLDIVGAFVPDLIDGAQLNLCQLCQKGSVACGSCGTVQWECPVCGCKLVSTASSTGQYYYPLMDWGNRVINTKYWRGEDFFQIQNGVAVTKRGVDVLRDSAIYPFEYRPLRHLRIDGG